MQIIPAIDIIENKCVRLIQGDYAQKTVYDQSPLDLALQFEQVGMKRLHLVDLDGARSGKIASLGVLEEIARKTSLEIDFGGGIKSEEDLRAVFNAGAAMVSIGSIAVKDPELFQGWLMTYGPDKIILGADVNNHQVMISGWLEKTSLDIFDFIAEKTRVGIRQLFCTDISKDGKLEGPSIALYREILKRYPSLYLIASGGVSSVSDLTELRAVGCKAAIVGKAIYEERIKLTELAQFLDE